MAIYNKKCSSCDKPYICNGSCSCDIRIGAGIVPNGVKCYCPVCVRDKIIIKKEEWWRYVEDRGNCSLLSKEDWKALKSRSLFTWIVG